jgi:LppX_LprAFG lipoprotein
MAMRSVSTRTRARGVATAALGIVMLALGGCGGGGDRSASEILSRTAVETAKQKSFHVVIAMDHVATSPTGLTLTFVDGELLVPSRLRARVAGTFRGVPLTSELVSIGRSQYLRDPFSGKWQRVSLRTSPIAFFDPAKGVLAVVKSAQDVERNGSEKVDDVDTYRLKAKVRASALTPLLGNPSSGRLLPVELWIGKSDSLLRRIRLAGAVAPGESGNALRTVAVSRFGEHVTIVPPPVGS